MYGTDSGDNDMFVIDPNEIRWVTIDIFGINIGLFIK